MLLMYAVKVTNERLLTNCDYLIIRGLSQTQLRAF